MVARGGAAFWRKTHVWRTSGATVGVPVTQRGYANSADVSEQQPWPQVRQVFDAENQGAIS
jgi:hypothetical protein